MADDAIIIEYKPDSQINRFFNNFSGTRCICFDNKGQSYLFEASTENLILIN